MQNPNYRLQFASPRLALLVFLCVPLILAAGLRVSALSPAAPDDSPPLGLDSAWLVTGLAYSGCDDFETSFDSEEIVVPGNIYTFETIVSHGDQVYMTEARQEQPISAGAGSVDLYENDDLGLVNVADPFPLPADTLLDIQLTLYQGLSETPVYRTRLAYTCNTGSYQILSFEPLLPAAPTLDLSGRLGLGCTAGSLVFNAAAKPLSDQPLWIDTSIRDSSQVYLTDSQFEVLDTPTYTIPVAVALPPSTPLTVTLTLRDEVRRPLYETAAGFQCDNQVYNFAYSTPRQPQQPAWILSDRVFPGCASGQSFFDLVHFIERGQAYYYETLVTQGDKVYMDSYQKSAAFNPGLNLWTLENANDRGLQTDPFPLPTDTPVQVTFNLYDAQERPLYQTTFDYLCDGAGTVSNAQGFAFPAVYLPLLRKP
jgi:hypothetical protein